MLTGPDVSHHQGAVDWAQVRSAGHAFAWCKATEGTGFVDSRFARNWPAIRAAGLVRGAYHFLRTESDPRAQARHFLDVVGDLEGSMACLDVETAGVGTNPTGAQARAFVDEFRARTGGRLIVVYTGRWYWQGVIGNPAGVDLGPLWHSAYSASPGATYGGWTAFTFWQHTSTGSCPGIAGPCDLNRFYGTTADLAALTGHPQEHDMTADEYLAILNDPRVAARHRELIQLELDEGTAFGNLSWSASQKNLVELCRSILNRVMALDGTDVDEGELAKQLLPGLLEVVGAENFADAVAEHLGAEQSRIFLDDFANRLAA